MCCLLLWGYKKLKVEVDVTKYIFNLVRAVVQSGLLALLKDFGSFVLMRSELRSIIMIASAVTLSRSKDQWTE